MASFILSPFLFIDFEFPKLIFSLLLLYHSVSHLCVLFSCSLFCDSSSFITFTFNCSLTGKVYKRIWFGSYTIYFLDTSSECPFFYVLYICFTSVRFLIFIIPYSVFLFLNWHISLLPCRFPCIVFSNFIFILGRFKHLENFLTSILLFSTLIHICSIYLYTDLKNLINSMFLFYFNARIIR